MKKIVSALFFFIVICCSLNFQSRIVINVSATYSYDVFSITERVSHSDKVFTGMISEVVDVLEYDETGIPMPYTIYKIKVNEFVKGVYDDEFINVTYFGGQSDNKIITLNTEYKNTMEVLPVLNEYYLFLTTDIHEDTGRLKSGMNIASTPHSVNWLEDYQSDTYNETVSTYENTFYSITGEFTDDIVFDGGDGGGVINDGSSFSKAILLEDEHSYSKSFWDIYSSYYFKFIISDVKFIDVESLFGNNNIDVDIALYNSSYGFITGDDDSGDNTNFNLLYTLNGGTYYLKVTNEDNQTGGFTLQYDESDVAQVVNSMTNLVSNLDSVNEDKEIIYEVETNFPYETELNKGVLLWKNLGHVNLLNSNHTDKTTTLRIESFYENNNIDGIWIKDGVTLSTPLGDIPVADLLKVNEYTFGNYSENQRTRIIAHEFGHALGLHEFNSPIPFGQGGNSNITTNESEQNVMRQMNTPLQKLGSADIAVYNYLWDY